MAGAPSVSAFFCLSNRRRANHTPGSVAPKFLPDLQQRRVAYFFALFGIGGKDLDCDSAKLAEAPAGSDSENGVDHGEGGPYRLTALASQFFRGTSSDLLR